MDDERRTLNAELAPAANPMRLIGRAARSFARVADVEMRGLGLAMSQLTVLAALKCDKALSQAELAKRAQVEQPSMAQLLNRMERDGLIERLPDPADKRSRLISLTALAHRRLPKGKAILGQRLGEALAGFDEREIAQLVALLQRMNDNLDLMIDAAVARECKRECKGEPASRKPATAAR